MPTTHIIPQQQQMTIHLSFHHFSAQKYCIILIPFRNKIYSPSPNEHLKLPSPQHNLLYQLLHYWPGLRYPHRLLYCIQMGIMKVFGFGLIVIIEGNIFGADIVSALRLLLDIPYGAIIRVNNKIMNE